MDTIIVDNWEKAITEIITIWCPTGVKTWSNTIQLVHCNVHVLCMVLLDGWTNDHSIIETATYRISVTFLMRVKYSINCNYLSLNWVALLFQLNYIDCDSVLLHWLQYISCLFFIVEKCVNTDWMVQLAIMATYSVYYLYSIVESMKSSWYS